MEEMIVDKDNLYQNPIATPLAGPKLERKLFRITKKIFKYKGVRRGVKEVCKSIRKKHKGIVVFAADVYPVDVYSHIPVLCESNNIPYVFVKSRVELGLASETKRPTSVVMLQTPTEDQSLQSKFIKLAKKIKND